MNKYLTAGLAVAVLAFLAGRASALGHKGCDGCCPPPCADLACETAPCPTPPPPSVCYVEQTVTCYKPEWHEREETCTVDKITFQTDTKKQKVLVKIPVFTEEKQLCTVNTYVPHTTEHDQVCCRTVSVCVTDPCTGCTHTECKPETFVQKVKCVTWETVPVQKEVTVKVCSAVKTEERTVECKEVCCQHTPTTETKKVPYVVMVPYQTTVKVPVPACPATPCCGQ